MSKLLTSFKVTLFFTLLLGGGYHAILLLFGHTFFAQQAAGSLLVIAGEVRGSFLIGQKFTSKYYFHGRPSAINYNARYSGSDHWSLGDEQFQRVIRERSKLIRKNYGLAATTKIPGDMVLSSASGLDPHISLGNALLQLYRVYKARRLSKKTIRKLIWQAVDHDFVGIWGKSGVNVLKLNLSLDQAEEELR